MAQGAKSDKPNRRGCRQRREEMFSAFLHPSPLPSCLSLLLPKTLHASQSFPFTSHVLEKEKIAVQVTTQQDGQTLLNLFFFFLTFYSNGAKKLLTVRLVNVCYSYYTYTYTTEELWDTYDMQIITSLLQYNGVLTIYTIYLSTF